MSMVEIDNEDDSDLNLGNLSSRSKRSRKEIIKDIKMKKLFRGGIIIRTRRVGDDLGGAQVDEKHSVVLLGA